MHQTLPATPTARLPWFEDAMDDIPLQRPVEPAAGLASFTAEVGGRG